MPRPISSGLAARIADPAFSCAILGRVDRRDGVSLGFTSWDVPIVYAGLTYYPTDGLKVSAISGSVGAGVDYQDVTGFLTDNRIKAEDLKSRRYKRATYKVSVVDPTDLSLGDCPLAVGRIGEVTQQGVELFMASIPSLSSLLKIPVGEIVNNRCVAGRVGDARCKVNLGGSSGGTAYRTVKTGVTTSGGSLSVTDTSPAGWFAFGIVKALTGQNAGMERDCKTHTVASGVATLVLNQGFPYPFAPTDQVQLTVGCNRTVAMCRSKFSNANNFRAFPYLIGTAKFLQVGR